MITETIELSFDTEDQRRAFHEALERPFSSRQAAAHLLPLFLDGQFENCGDDRAQEAFDTGGCPYDIIGNWLRGVSGQAEPAAAPTIEPGDGALTSAPRRAPHMERYTRVKPYRTEEHRDGHKVELTIGVQGFLISDGADNHHESRAAAEWCRRQLCVALDTLRSEVIEECAKIVSIKREQMRFSDQRDMCDEIETSIRALKDSEK